MSELNTFLAELSGAGDLDSQGVFTVAAHKALQKLRRSQLLDPRLYPVFVVAAAVAAGATEVKAYSNGPGTTYQFDADLDPTRLASLADTLAGPGHDDAERARLNLALALAAASRISQSITLETAGTAFEYVCTDTDVELHELSSSHPHLQPRTRIHLGQGNLAGLKRWFSGWPELQTLLSTCRYAPLSISVSQQPAASRPVDMGVASYTAFGWRHLVAPGHGCRLLVQRPEPALSPFCAIDPEPVASPGPYSAVLTLDDPRSCFQHGLILVTDGIAFRRPATLLGTPLACAVVAAPGLNRNLSHTDLVEDEAYQSLLESLRGEVEDLLEWRLATPRTLPNRDVTRLAVFYLGELADAARDAGDETRAQQLNLRLNRIRLAEDTSLWKYCYVQLRQTLESEPAESDSEASAPELNLLSDLSAMRDLLAESARPDTLGLDLTREFFLYLRDRQDVAALTLLKQRLQQEAAAHCDSARFDKAANLLGLLVHADWDRWNPARVACLALDGQVEAALGHLGEQATGSDLRSQLLRLLGFEDEARLAPPPDINSGLGLVRAHRLACLANARLRFEHDPQLAVDCWRLAVQTRPTLDNQLELHYALWLALRAKEAVQVMDDILRRTDLKPELQGLLLDDQAEVAAGRAGLLLWVRCRARASLTLMAGPSDPLRGCRTYKSLRSGVEAAEAMHGTGHYMARRCRRLAALRLRTAGDWEQADFFAIRESLLREIQLSFD